MLIADVRTAWCRTTVFDGIPLRLDLEKTTKNHCVPILGSISALHAPLNSHAPVPGILQ